MRTSPSLEVTFPQVFVGPQDLLAQYTHTQKHAHKYVTERERQRERERERETMHTHTHTHNTHTQTHNSQYACIYMGPGTCSQKLKHHTQ